MKISRVQIENYRNLRHVDVELDSIVTVVGENNCGKTNFLRALSIPLVSDEDTGSKRLSWYDINDEAKKEYYDYLNANRETIVDGSVDINDFITKVPFVTVVLYFSPEENEHYNVKDILVDVAEWQGAIRYCFSVKKKDEFYERVRSILIRGSENVQMSLLPVELYEYTITTPGKDVKISYDTISCFRAVGLPAERDSFSSSADKIGSKALTSLMQKRMKSDAQVEIEKAYRGFFETVKKAGKLDEILNWQDYNDVPRLQDFFKRISVLPNMPQMSSILGSVRLGYDDESMFMQGLGHRNIVLLTVLANYYISHERDISYRLLTIEEPEAHLCINNQLLIINLLNILKDKNKYTQIVYSTHSTEFVNKMGLDKVIVFHHGAAFSLQKELEKDELDYLSANPNTDLLTLLYSKRLILVEGFTEELLIKAYLQSNKALTDIKVLSFHKGFKRIIEIWKKINEGTDNKLGIVRDNDDEPKAKEKHERLQSNNVIVRTTSGYTLETDITSRNYQLLIQMYGNEYNWSKMTEDEVQLDWRSKKSDVMLRICHDLVSGRLVGFRLPLHIEEVIDFVRGDQR